jgi:hypothetical protein
MLSLRQAGESKSLVSAFFVDALGITLALAAGSHLGTQLLTRFADTSTSSRSLTISTTFSSAHDLT